MSCSFHRWIQPDFHGAKLYQCKLCIWHKLLNGLLKCVLLNHYLLCIQHNDQYILWQLQIDFFASHYWSFKCLFCFFKLLTCKNSNKELRCELVWLKYFKYNRGIFKYKVTWFILYERTTKQLIMTNENDRFSLRTCHRPTCWIKINDLNHILLNACIKSNWFSVVIAELSTIRAKLHQWTVISIDV